MDLKAVKYGSSWKESYTILYLPKDASQWVIYLNKKYKFFKTTSGLTIKNASVIIGIDTN